MEPRAETVLKLVFSQLHQKDKVERKALAKKEGLLVKRIANLIVELIVETDQISLNMDAFTKERWNLHIGSVHSQFGKVAAETFRDEINWGRILTFLGFAVSFSLFLEKELMLDSAEESVLQWTCQVVEEKLQEYIFSHGGWEEFADYLEVALRAVRLLSTRSSGKTSLTFAAGAVAIVAVMTVLALRWEFA